MKRTNMIFGKRGAAFAVAGMAAMLGFSSAAKADTPDPNLLLDYSALDFEYTRNATAIGAGNVVGNFLIRDVAGTTLDAILRDGLLNEIDRATISSDTDFNVSVGGSVTYNGANSYTLNGFFAASDDTGTVKMNANFSSSVVSMSGPPAFSNVLQIAGGLSNPFGILRDASSATDWSFAGHAGDTVDARDIGGDDLISIGGVGDLTAYDTGTLVDFTLGVNFDTLDSLFSQSTTVIDGDMKVTIVPAPTALVLGMIGFGAVGWFRRRMS